MPNYDPMQERMFMLWLLRSGKKINKISKRGKWATYKTKQEDDFVIVKYEATYSTMKSLVPKVTSKVLISSNVPLLPFSSRF